jgi:hypothetical protein
MLGSFHHGETYPAIVQLPATTGRVDFPTASRYPRGPTSYLVFG